MHYRELQEIRVSYIANKGIDVNSVTGYSVHYQKYYELDGQTLPRG